MTQEQIDALRAAALHASSFNPLTNDFTEERSRLDALATEAHPLAILALLAERDALLRVAEAVTKYLRARADYEAWDAGKSDADALCLIDAEEETKAALDAALAALTPGETDDAR